MERTEEFDAFGPWVLPVSTADEVPRLFRPHAGDPQAAEVVLKVPRAIARRDANPAMDLYDHLLLVRDGAVVLLTRAPGERGGVRRRSLAADELLAIEESVNLLDGRLLLVAKEGPSLRVSFNGASRDTVRSFVDVVRGLWTQGSVTSEPQPEQHPIPLGLRDLGPEVALVNEYRALVAAEPAMRLLGAHPRQVVEPAATGSLAGMTRVAHWFLPMSLQGAIVCTDGREVMVLHRRPWWVRGQRPVHSVARTALPIARAGGLDVVNHSGYLGVRLVRIGGVLELPVPAGSPGEAALRSAFG